MFYKNNGIRDINLPTNAIKTDRLIEWVTRIRKSCPNSNITISVSMDGFGETHDKQRGVESFYNTCAALKKIDEHFKGDGFVLKNMATVVTKYNVDEILDFVSWVYGRFNISTHTIEAARGNTREEGVKILTEKSMSEIQDKIAPFYLLYAKRIADGMGLNKIGRAITKFFYVGLYRAWFNIRVKNIDKPTCWEMDCTAGVTSLVIDYDGRFRACEIRDPVGKVQDYDCDVQKLMASEAMQKEVKDIGYGYKANCWCTHGCWIMSSMNFNPGKMLSMLIKANKQTKKLSKGKDVAPTEEKLRALESKYKLDSQKLQDIGLMQKGAA
jgi:MoaA/NifB/PqqE/SkfB family radical SAM enzyme